MEQEQKQNGARTKTKKRNGKVIVGAAALILAIAAYLVVFNVFREKAAVGSKSISIEVIDQEEKSVQYQVRTDAEFLRQAMEEAEGLTFDGETGAYGFTLYTINGETHNWNVDGSYWAVYVNGEYANYGVDEQSVKDGDAFKFQYTPPAGNP